MDLRGVLFLLGLTAVIRLVQKDQDRRFARVWDKRLSPPTGTRRSG